MLFYRRKKMRDLALSCGEPKVRDAHTAQIHTAVIHLHCLCFQGVRVFWSEKQCVDLSHYGSVSIMSESTTQPALVNTQLVYAVALRFLCMCLCE